MKAIFLCFIMALMIGCKSEHAVLNAEHQFVITGNTIFYNDQQLHLQSDISQWVSILGPYSRMVDIASDIYVWDKIGIYVYTLPNKPKVNSIIFAFREDEYEPVHVKNFFKNAVSLDGALIHRDSTINDVNSSKSGLFFSKGYAQGIYHYDYNVNTPDSTYIRINLLPDRTIRTFGMTMSKY